MRSSRPAIPTTCYARSKADPGGAPALKGHPSSPPPAATATVAFDLDGQTRSVTDALGDSYNFFSSPFRSARATPLGFATVTNYDEYGREVLATDPIGRMTSTAWDGRDRVVSVTRPEGDATTTAYDVRSNVVRQSHIAKPGSSLAMTVVGATYGEGPAVTTCVNPVTCNKPATAFDALAWVLSGGAPTAALETQLAYNAATGQPTQILKPADPSGNRPRSDFGYTTLGGRGRHANLADALIHELGGAATCDKTVTFGRRLAALAGVESLAGDTL